MATASAPVNVRAKKIISRARRSPMIRGRYCVAPTVGQAPTLAPVCPKTAFSEAMTMSHHSASSWPPPMQKPLTMAMTGTCRPRMVMAVSSMRSFHRWPFWRFRRIIAWKSPPAEKARSPAPVITTATTVRSSRTDRRARTISSSVCSRNALWYRGRSIVSQATWSEISNAMSS
jgi:hypothetical protein